ncbi:hypothetical protein GCM10010361_74090 [Streptomyces olivaceiscleroticus]|uniref:Uncharacterized protein n=1 Tax=Streptomyces olivaceiscleroticus TaxID=68245 RepID=A0ABP3LC55_9ACTN
MGAKGGDGGAGKAVRRLDGTDEVTVPTGRGVRPAVAVYVHRSTRRLTH